jgi:hypothetical protein
MQHKFKFSVSSSFEGYPSKEDETYLLHLLIELTFFIYLLCAIFISTLSKIIDNNLKDKK